MDGNRLRILMLFGLFLACMMGMLFLSRCVRLIRRSAGVAVIALLALTLTGAILWSRYAAKTNAVPPVEYQTQQTSTLHR